MFEADNRSSILTREEILKEDFLRERIVTMDLV